MTLCLSGWANWLSSQFNVQSDFFTSVLKIAVIVESNWQSTRMLEVDGRNLLGGGNSTPVNSRNQQRGGGGIMVVGPKHLRGVSE